MIGRALAFAGLAKDAAVAAASVGLHLAASSSALFSCDQAVHEFWIEKSGCPSGRHRQGTSSNTATQPREHPREETAVAHPQPISVYVGIDEIRTGRPSAVVDRDEHGTPRVRTHPAGIGGPYMQITPEDWAIWNAVVVSAIEDAGL